MGSVQLPSLFPRCVLLGGTDNRGTNLFPLTRSYAMHRRVLILSVAFLAATAAGLAAAEPQLAHMVFFTLKEDTQPNRETLMAACRKHLSDHEGTVYFSVGAVADDLDREVNDREFDIALHMVFQNKAAHDQYQPHPRHLKFIEENKHLWSKVRVFDSYVPAKGK
jgi:hypothetical protein